MKDLKLLAKLKTELSAPDFDEKEIEETSELLPNAHRNEEEENTGIKIDSPSPTPTSTIDDQVDPEPSRYERATSFSVLYCYYIIQNLCAMRKKRNNNPDPLKLEDLPLLGQTEEVCVKINKIESGYNKYRMKHKSPSLFWPIFRVFWDRALKEQIFVLIDCSSKLLYTLFLSKILENLAAEDQQTAFKWAYCLIACALVSVHANHSHYFQATRTAAQLKPALMGLIYKKITRLSYYTINQVNIGKIVNIVANDLNAFDNGIYFLYYLTITPILLAASIPLLWSLVGPSCLTGIAVVFLVRFPQGKLASAGAKYLSAANKTTDQRIKLTNEMIEGIRLLKMYGWDTQYTNKITQTRDKEISLLTKLGYTYYMGGHFFSRLSPVLGSFVIFITYALTGGQLTSSKVYSTIVMLNFLCLTTVHFPNIGLRFAIQAKQIFQRIIDVLEIEESRVSQTVQSINLPHEPTNAVEFDNFSIFLEEKSKKPLNPQTVDESLEKPALQNLTFTVKRGTLCAFVGQIGSGKSILLKSFFNEASKTKGELRFSGRVAYVEHEAIIFPGTVRSNIIFGGEFDKTRYNQVIQACCLVDDFKQFPHGDSTEIGERGVNLSGGQKARLSLARALYSEADIYLLDDPLSAVDTHVANVLFTEAIRGLLKNKTVLLATHQVHFAREADQMIVLENGCIKAMGALDEIIKQDSSILSIFQTRNNRNTDDVETDNSEEGNKEQSPSSLALDGEETELLTDRSISSVVDLHPEETKAKTEEAKVKEEKGKLVCEEKDESSEVGWRLYWYYIKNAGGVVIISSFAALLAAIEFFNVFYHRYAGHWIEGESTPGSVMALLGGFIVAFMLSLALREKFYVDLGLKISNRLHGTILYRVVRAPIQFFDTNPTGRILNRFSNDVGVMDRYLLVVQSQVLNSFFNLPASFLTVCIVVPWLIIPLCILILVVALIVRLLKHISFQAKSLELTTKSPIYTFFSTTLFGLISIKVYGQESSFISRFTNLLNRNCRAYIFYYEIARFLAFYLELSTVLFSGVGIAIVLTTDLSPSLVGLTCTYLLSITDSIQFAVRQFFLYEMQMANTARVKAYTELELEAPYELPSDENIIRQSWPSEGAIKFNNIFLKYRANTDYVINGLSLSVKPGEKIGCVGRTGAGKSSIIQALFRMVEIDKNAYPGTSIMIDDVDTSEIGLHALRKSISIIPQTPFIFTGTIRSNLDPLQKYTDEEIIQALEETGLWEYVRTLPGGLDTEMANASSVFSFGQKQLISLARIFLHKNKIVVLDEATANIDFETDNFIQQKIMEKFKNETIFTIAHRLSTVANYDKILVMKNGRAVEFDHPFKLLAKDVSDETITNTEGVFASMVKNTGCKHAAVIFEIAKDSYLQKYK